MKKKLRAKKTKTTIIKIDDKTTIKSNDDFESFMHSNKEDKTK